MKPQRLVVGECPPGSFGAALESMKAGRRVKRVTWGDLSVGMGANGCIEFQGIACSDAYMPTDMFKNDWIVVEGEAA